MGKYEGQAKSLKFNLMRRQFGPGIWCNWHVVWEILIWKLHLEWYWEDSRTLLSKETITVV